MQLINKSLSLSKLCINFRKSFQSKELTFKCKMEHRSVKIIRNDLDTDSHHKAVKTHSKDATNIKKDSSLSDLPQSLTSTAPLIQQKYSSFVKHLQKVSTQHPCQHQLISEVICRYLNQEIYSFHNQKQQEGHQNFLSNPYLLMNYSKIMTVKTFTDFRFRKFDEVLTNIENQFYLLNYLKIEKDMAKDICRLCDKYLMTLMFHDHARLRELLDQDYSRNQPSSQRQMQRKGRKVSRRHYDLTQENPQPKKKSVNTLFKAFKQYIQQENVQSMLIRSMAYAIIGQVKKSLQLLCLLLNKDRSNPTVLSSFLTIYIYFGNQNFIKIKKDNSNQIRSFVKEVLCNRNVDIELSHIPAILSPTDAQYLVNSMLSFVYDEPLEWTDLDKQKLREFSYPLYLIGQNSYVSGDKQMGLRIVDELRQKLETQGIKLIDEQKGRRVKDRTYKVLEKNNLNQNSQIFNLFRFFNLTALFDSKSFEDIKSLEAQFSQRQKETFYLIQSVQNDILRSNSYEIFAQSFKLLKLPQKYEEFQSLSLGNHCVNDTYQMNDIEEQDQQVKKQYEQLNLVKGNKIIKKGILPHYLYINLKKIFNQEEYL